jgi:D-alanyl-D-alanine carboxypeptidase
MVRWLIALLCAVGFVAGPLAPAVAATPIQEKYQSLGGAAGPLGAPVSAETCGLRDGGCYQTYQNGSIVWSPASGAHPVRGGIRAAWGSTGFENGKLGYPTGSEACGLRGGGCYQNFQGGQIHWSPATGAHPTWGGLAAAWAKTGWENGKLGYPTGSEVCGLRGGGCYQSYQGGSIHWSPATGGHPTWGGIRAAWARTGYENGKLGYPTGSEVCGLRGGGCYQSFQGGSIHWSPATGGQPTWGAIRAAWARLGYENGALGYPTAAEACASGSCTQTYQRGVIGWSAGAGISMRLDIDIASSTSVVVNKRRPLAPAGYVPGPLVSVEGQLMRSDAAASAQRLIQDARAAGVPVTAVSAYRSYQTQATLYNNYVAQYGQATADTISARPGYSEHQTGLAVDLGNPNGACALQECFAGTPAGAWAANNAWRYGFIIRYPQGLSSVTGYAYEPWHLRYVGTLIASEMRVHGIPTLEQYMALPAAPTY